MIVKSEQQQKTIIFLYHPSNLSAENIYFLICHMPRIWTVLLEKVNKSLTEFGLNIKWL